MNYEQLSHDVKQTYQQVTASLGEAFPFENLLTFIDTRRVKPAGLHIVELPSNVFRPGITGCALGLPDADIIGVRKHLDTRRYLPVRLHEGSHFLLKHVPKVSEGAENMTLNDFTRVPNLQHALLREPANSYNKPDEDAAEDLARLLLKCINRYGSSMPSVASDVYLF